MSITYLAHLVPMNHDKNMTDSLAARVHDPLWFLGRQWQFGEFQGEDAGSPVVAFISGSLSELTCYAFMQEGKVAYREDLSLHECLLDALVEGQSVIPKDGMENYRLRAEAGEHFFRLLRLANPDLEMKYRSAYLKCYPLDKNAALLNTEHLDDAGRRFYSLISGRVIDGVALSKDLVKALQQGTLPSDPAIEKSDMDAVMHVAIDWRDWFHELYGHYFEGSAWNANRMEYNLATSAPGSFVANPGQSPLGNEVRLDAREHRGGRLDWYSFDTDLDPSTRSLKASGSARAIERSCFPTPLRFSGMATARYWEFEDGQVNLTKVSAAPEDLPRLLMLEFMLVYGNDFFGFPLDMDFGSICQINEIRVRDTFDQFITISPAVNTGSWAMYSLTYDVESKTQGAANLFFLAPTLGPILEGKAVEQVRFLRDEMANLVWAVEHKVLGQHGLTVNQFEVAQEKKSHDQAKLDAEENNERQRSEEVLYHLTSADQVPAYWFPFIPTPDGSGSYTLRQGQLSNGLGQHVPLHTEPWGEILSSLSSLEIPEEEIPREGIEIQRNYRLGRKVDGSTVLWLARRRKTGRGEGSSGLRFDYISTE